MKQYDYIFTGAGLSALMTVYKMVLSGKFNDKTILLLDENAKKTNDRTWCFWTKKKGIWNNIISKTWDSALFANQDFQRNLDLNPYQYHMVKGLDFYTQVFDVISKEKNIEMLPNVQQEGLANGVIYHAIFMALLSGTASSSLHTSVT